MGRYFHLFFLVLAAAYLVFATVVQYNDPDPVHWMALYGLTAFCTIAALTCTIAALTGRTWPWLLWLLMGMSLTEMLIALDGFLRWISIGSDNLLTTPMSAERPWIEQSREFLGAAINLGIVWYLLRLGRSVK